MGAGAFGRVYLGLNNDTGQLMAVKQVRMMLGPSIVTANITVLLGGQPSLLVDDAVRRRSCCTVRATPDVSSVLHVHNHQ